MTKILHLVAGSLGGGAARGAAWLHNGLLAQGVESRILTSGPPVDDPTIFTLESGGRGKLKRMLRTELDRLAIGTLYREAKGRGVSAGLFGYNVMRSEHYDWAEILHLHWINQGAFNVAALHDCPKPIVWTLRDMWPMTGVCHYAIDCDGYKTGCGACPQLGSKARQDLSRFLARRKRKKLPANFQAVAISQWLATCAAESFVFGGRSIKTVPNCVDGQEFFPVPKSAARLALGLPNESQIVMFGNISHDTYKGADLAISALKRLTERNSKVQVLSVGGRNDLDIPGVVHHFGTLRDNVSMRLAYSAADIFLTASRAEAFGKMLVEAMACATPVVAFDSTGPRDIVVNKKTGYLAKPFCPDDLANGADWILRDLDRQQELARRSRARALECFNPNVVAKAYMDIYDKCLARQFAANKTSVDARLDTTVIQQRTELS